MKRLLEDFPQVRLALSLHSAVEETRSQIVPFNRRFSVADLRATLIEIGRGSRRISLEVVFLKGINDGIDEAVAIANFAKDTAAHVNLIPFHPFPGAPYERTEMADIQRFKAEIEQHFGGVVTIRKSRGLDIDGACGQLA